MLVLAVPKERTVGERRIALVPEIAKRLIKLGVELRIEQSMGESAFFKDEAFG